MNRDKSYTLNDILEATEAASSRMRKWPKWERDLPLIGGGLGKTEMTEKTGITKAILSKITARNITVGLIVLGVVVIVGFFTLQKGTCHFNLKELDFDCEDVK